LTKRDQATCTRPTVDNRGVNKGLNSLQCIMPV